MLSSAPVADASSTKCVASETSSYNCVVIKGYATQVNSVDGQRFVVGDFLGPIPLSGTICEWKMNMIITLPGKSPVSHWTPHQPGCDRYAAYYTWNLNKAYPDNTTVCIRAYEQGAFKPGVPCQTVKAVPKLPKVVDDLIWFLP